MTSIQKFKLDSLDLGKIIQTWDRSGIALLTGNAKIYHLAHIWIAVLIAKGYRVHVIDCAVRFNVYRMIDSARALNLDVQEFLFAGIVQRAFTPYQILDVCHAILNQNLSGNDIYFILSPSKQFFDGDVKDSEGFFLLDKLISVFEKIQSRGIPLVAVESKKYKHKTFHLLFPKLYTLANALWEYDSFPLGRESLQRFSISYKNTMFGNLQYQFEISGGENGKNGNALFESFGHDERALSRF
jgi:hypothetical protein